MFYCNSSLISLILQNWINFQNILHAFRVNYFYLNDIKQTITIRIMMNRNKWQVLIKVRRTKNILELLVMKKKYPLFMISTMWEKKKKTNFSYNHNQTIEMIDICYSNNQIFNSSMFLRMNYVKYIGDLQQSQELPNSKLI